MKDLFSTASDDYARYRPSYPEELYEYILSQLSRRDTAWDCGTGNGQVAERLAKDFALIHATDISKEQIARARKNDRISYSIQPAEQTDFQDNSFDLIIVAQAIHWFEFDLFYKEVKRTLKNDGLFVVTGYGLLHISNDIDPILYRFYSEIVGPFWEPERKYIDEGYRMIPFPFEELETPDPVIKMKWSFDHLIGYLETWSAVKSYIKIKNQNPVDFIREELRKSWGSNSTREIRFSVPLRAGKKR